MKVRRTKDDRITIDLDIGEAEHLFNVLTAAEIHAPSESSRFAARLQVELKQAGIGPFSQDEE